MTTETRRRQIVVGITGASGAAYARRLIYCLCERDTDVHLVVSPYGRRLLNDELGVKEVTAAALGVSHTDRLVIHPYRDVGSVLGSGSFRTDGMIICPCSTNSLGALASGLGSNLLSRAAAVTLKELRRLVLVVREMPLGRIELSNALRLQEAGAVICPASPGFYMNPQSVDDLVDFVVGKLLDLVEVPHTLDTRWRGTQDSTAEQTNCSELE